jgi:hypothetical protein
MSSALWDGKTEHKSFVLKREDLLPLSSACDILMIMLAARSHIAKDGACYIGERIIYADSATVFMPTRTHMDDCYCTDTSNLCLLHVRLDEEAMALVNESKD